MKHAGRKRDGASCFAFILFSLAKERVEL